MPKMHLNVETVRDAQDQMARDQTQIAEMVATLTEAVHGLEAGAWVGNSASQFFSEYEAMDTAWRRQMEIMRVLAERFKQEIEEWQHVSEKFG